MGKTDVSNREVIVMINPKLVIKRKIKKILEKKGYHLSREVFEDRPGYAENSPQGYQNFSEKMNRLRLGQDFEWPNMIALNQGVASLIGNAKKIVNIGSGTGIFEWHVSVDKKLNLIASEFDSDCVEWCKEHRQRENITYCSLGFDELLKEFKSFDLAVSIDVIEHVADYSEFLSNFSKLAPRGIITTPNKARDLQSLNAQPPSYYQHVREWTAGEFYWVLRCFYDKVELYALDDPFSPGLIKIGL